MNAVINKGLHGNMMHFIKQKSLNNPFEVSQICICFHSVTHKQYILNLSYLKLVKYLKLAGLHQKVNCTCFNASFTHILL